MKMLKRNYVCIALLLMVHAIEAANFVNKPYKNPALFKDDVVGNQENNQIPLVSEWLDAPSFSINPNGELAAVRDRNDSAINSPTSDSATINWDEQPTTVMSLSNFKNTLGNDGWSVKNSSSGIPLSVFQDLANSKTLAYNFADYHQWDEQQQGSCNSFNVSNESAFSLYKPISSNNYASNDYLSSNAKDESQKKPSRGYFVSLDQIGETDEGNDDEQNGVTLFEEASITRQQSMANLNALCSKLNIGLVTPKTTIIKKFREKALRIPPFERPRFPDSTMLQMTKQKADIETGCFNRRQPSEEARQELLKLNRKPIF